MRSRRKRRKQPLLKLVLEGTTALVASANFALVLFDLTYVAWRDFWLQGNLQLLGIEVSVPLPPVTEFYDTYKGIEPHRDTRNYLNQVDRLESLVASDGLESPSVKAQLEELRDLSVAMVDENPFQIADKSGTLERVKNRMRDHLELESSKQAFRQFWSEDYLSRKGWGQEIQFFNQEVRPLIATNYYRGLGETGDFVDRFWEIDLLFLPFFAIEFLLRIFLIHRRYPSLSIREAALWRWYDLPLFLPFWRWLRILPVAIRLQDSQLINFETIRAQFGRGFVAIFAGELTEAIAVQTINQVQGSVKRGEIARWLLRDRESSEYLDINDTNELQEIIRRLSQLVVYQVLPKIQPDLEELMCYSIDSALSQSPAYNGLQVLPGMETLQSRITQQVVLQLSRSVVALSQNTYDTLAATDPKLLELSERLGTHFGEALWGAVQNQETLQELQGLVVDLLEEVKINYIRQLTQQDFEQILEESQQIARKFES